MVALKTSFFILFLIVMLLIANNSLAQNLPLPPTSIIISWSMPTERENGDALPVENIAGYELFNSCETDIIEVVGGAVTSHTIAIDTPYSCAFLVVAIDTDGLRSGASETLLVTFNPPKAPIINEITIN